MNNDKLRSDWDALPEEEKEEVLNAFKCALEAVKHATIVFAETAIKVMPELSKSNTSDLMDLSDKEEGVS